MVIVRHILHSDSVHRQEKIVHTSNPFCATKFPINFFLVFEYQLAAVSVQVVVTVAVAIAIAVVVVVVVVVVVEDVVGVVCGATVVIVTVEGRDEMGLLFFFLDYLIVTLVGGRSGVDENFAGEGSAVDHLHIGDEGKTTVGF